uniref:Ata11 protein n=1 Tax=Saccharothrix mutabilis subsp. capreolus TaxID=66854 RepID=Q83W08_STRMP|nr:Ata11 protein [Saccharothrix mutabilis subsp. capreolus]
MTDRETASRLTPTWGWWEPGTVELMRRMVTPGSLVFDVGAHVGYYTTLLADLVGPTGRVHAFEPHPGNFQAMRGNTEALPNVTITNTAVADGAGARPLHFSGNTGRHSLFRTEFTGEAGRAVEVPTTTLSEYWERLGRPRVDLIKVDVEGAEPLVIAGARELLAANPDVLVITEYYPRNLRWGGSDEHHYLELLRRSGLTCQTIDDDGGLRPDLPSLQGDDYVNLLCRRDGPADPR